MSYRKMHCTECGHRFDSDECGLVREYEHLSGRPTICVEYSVCPHCGDEGIEEYLPPMCPTCEGDGCTEFDEVCPDCGGSGAKEAT
jgi:hypothetical protein